MTSQHAYDTAAKNTDSTSYVATLLSYVTRQSASEPATPIKVIRPDPTSTTSSPDRVLLPRATYPAKEEFKFAKLVESVDATGLIQAWRRTTDDVAASFAETIKSLTDEQHNLSAQISSTDTLAKSVLTTTKSRAKKTDKEAALLTGHEKLSVLAEKTYTSVENLIRLFRDIDDILPPSERIEHHKAHYQHLAPLITRFDEVFVRPTPSRAVSALRDVQDMRHETATEQVVDAEEVHTEDALTEASVEDLQDNTSKVSTTNDQISTPVDPPPTTPLILKPPDRLLAVSKATIAPPTIVTAPTDSQHLQPLRLAPKKSRSNLRVPQIKTVPPLPSPQLSTALPTFERDNMSTRTSIASRRTIMSTISYFWNTPRKPPGTAASRLRKISGQP